MAEERTVSAFTWITPARRSLMSIRQMGARTIVQQHYTTETKVIRVGFLVLLVLLWCRMLTWTTIFLISILGSQEFNYKTNGQILQPSEKNIFEEKILRIGKVARWWRRWCMAWWTGRRLWTCNITRSWNIILSWFKLKSPRNLSCRYKRQNKQ